jgi:hypothetical protein
MSTTSTCYAQHHVMSMLTKIIQDNQAKTKLLRFVSIDDPFVAVELSRLFWLHFSRPVCGGCDLRQRRVTSTVF